MVCYTAAHCARQLTGWSRCLTRTSLMNCLKLSRRRWARSLRDWPTCLLSLWKLADSLTLLINLRNGGYHIVTGPSLPNNYRCDHDHSILPHSDVLARSLHLDSYIASNRLIRPLDSLPRHDRPGGQRVGLRAFLRHEYHFQCALTQELLGV